MLNYVERKEWEELVDVWLDNVRRGGTPDNLRDIENRSQPISFVRSFLKEAARRAQEAGHGPNDPETLALFENAFEVSSCIAHLYLPFEPVPQKEDAFRKATRMRLAEYGRLDLKSFAELKPNGALRDELELAVVDYLESQWRMPWADRLVLKLLLENELGQYLYEILRNDPLDEKGRSELQKAQLAARRTVLGQSLKVVFFTALALAVVVSAALSLPNAANVILPIGGGLVLLFGLIWLAIVVFYFLKYGPNVKMRANKTKELVRLAIDKAQVFSGDQPVSVSDFRRHVEALREAGFVLPQTLYGMLDMLDDEGKKIV
jgi:hypothetical protein